MKIGVDLINLSPSVLLDGELLKSVWIGNDITIQHFRVFGHQTFFHIPRDERSKLDCKFKQCIYMGDTHEEFGYKLWDPANKKVLKSRYVIFFED